jgi:hypothetical protein
VKAPKSSNPIKDSVQPVPAMPRHVVIYRVECSPHYWTRCYVNGRYLIKSTETSNKKIAEPIHHCGMSVTKSAAQASGGEQQFWRPLLFGLLMFGLSGCDNSGGRPLSVSEYPEIVREEKESPTMQTFEEDSSSIYLSGRTLFFLGTAVNSFELYDERLSSVEASISGKARLCETFCSVSDSEGNSQKASCSLSGVRVLSETTKQLFLEGEEKIEHRVLMSTSKVPLCTTLN